MEVTHGSLKKALHELGNWSFNGPKKPPWHFYEYSDHFAQDILNKLKENEKTMKTPDLPGDTTVTLQEVTEAFKRLGYSSTAHAPNIIQDILDHREPEWQKGDVVKDATGTLWVKDSCDFWLRPGMNARWKDVQLKRPLTPLKEVS